MQYTTDDHGDRIDIQLQGVFDNILGTHRKLTQRFDTLDIACSNTEVEEVDLSYTTPIDRDDNTGPDTLMVLGG